MKEIDRLAPLESTADAGEAITPMTAERAQFFMQRFKHEEKLLGPNEQAALDFVIELLRREQGREQSSTAPSSSVSITRKNLPEAEITKILERGDVAERNVNGGWHVLPYSLARAVEAAVQEAHGIR